jgi:hypothetical protein
MDRQLEKYIKDRDRTFNKNGKRTANGGAPFISNGILFGSVAGWGWTLVLILATLAVIVGTYAICICILWSAIQSAATNF